MTREFEHRSDVDALASSIILIDKVCLNRGVSIWLHYGALLGMTRERRLLPWNNDAELGSWYTETSHENLANVADDLGKLGFRCFYFPTFGTLNIKKGNGVDININLFWKVDGFALRPHDIPSKKLGNGVVPFLFYWLAALLFVYSGSANGTLNLATKADRIKHVAGSFCYGRGLLLRKKIFSVLMSLSRIFGGRYQTTALPVNYLDKVERISFYGASVNVPVNRKELLKLIYGEGWEVPKDQWSFYSEENKSTTGVKFLECPFDYCRVFVR